MIRDFGKCLHQSINKHSSRRATHEVQVLENDEADLHRHWTTCQKNPGHGRFIPVGDFTVNNLPIVYKTQVNVSIAKAISDLTVRIAVTCTTAKRPRYRPGTQFDYPFYNDAGSRKPRTGSGYVSHVQIFSGKRCRCVSCDGSQNPVLSWGEITISTATHVVFNDEEAEKTTFRLFFDRQDSPLVCVQGLRVEEANVEKDMTRVICVSHAVELLEKLDGMVEHWQNLSHQAYEKHKDSSFLDRLAIIVSHPHGCSKHVSVGEWGRRTKEADGDSWFTYTTCTCPGSSGAFVYILGSRWWHWYHAHAHRGVDDDGVNFSTVGYDGFETQH